MFPTSMRKPKRPLNKPMRKFKYLSSNMLRSGYSPNSEFACRYCGKRYKWKSTMRRHEEDECGDKEPKFICPYCPYKAKQKGNLKTHIRKHHMGNNDSGLGVNIDCSLGPTIDTTLVASVDSPLLGHIETILGSNVEKSSVGHNDSGVAE